MVMRASDSFKKKTTGVNQMWQTDFTYLKVCGWGWYYLSTIMDDYSRYIIYWELCKSMKDVDVERLPIHQQVQRLKKRTEANFRADCSGVPSTVYRFIYASSWLSRVLATMVNAAV